MACVSSSCYFLKLDPEGTNHVLRPFLRHHCLTDILRALGYWPPVYPEQPAAVHFHVDHVGEQSDERRKRKRRGEKLRDETESQR